MSGTIGDARKREAEQVAPDGISATETAPGRDCSPSMEGITAMSFTGPQIGAEMRAKWREGAIEGERGNARDWRESDGPWFNYSQRILMLIDALEATEAELAKAKARISTQDTELRQRRDANAWANPIKATAEAEPKDVQQMFIRFSEQRERAEKAEAERDELRARVAWVEALLPEWVEVADAKTGEDDYRRGARAQLRYCTEQLRIALRGDS